MVTILYARVESTDGVLLAEAQAVSSMHAASARKVLANIKGPLVERRCVMYNGYSYDILPHSDGTVYLCVTEKSCGRGTSFRFLEAAQRRCSSQRSNPASMAAELKEEVDLFNGAQSTRIRELRSEIETVKGAMIANVDKLLCREERLDTLLLQSSVLEGESSAFRQNARSLERQFLNRRIAIGVSVALVVLILLFVIIFMICSRGGANFDRCRSH
ncbi:putative vesicle-associated membrane protein 713 [Trypanosoma rangeli]|uniref:Putative vesicle-associated membrane protein 713 n=1 Tax=Trypanosoma rangeli TaxID=5698 RepID=A0A422N3E0_TRYRA|nr:putative vesicle-associated membrane protein 713 [Trypanosoma rangeli]RNF00003.1 putative vesicle-associated membrane protein 713 [Trypanosoma rangeli]|eukprot:RNF00003.1 putative vesicle-associated membrane protein 713 [Trypanosoma rangeli]